MQSIKVFLRSNTCLIVLFLSLFNIAFVYSNPLVIIRDVRNEPFDINKLAGKVSKYLNATTSEDIVLMGSSLLVVPSVRCDEILNHRRPRYDIQYKRNELIAYDKADYLSDQLRQNGCPAKVINLGIIACMISDLRIIQRKLIESSKHPKLIVYCIAPRDFLDNFHSNIEDSPLYKLLQSNQSDSNVQIQRLIDFCPLYSHRRENCNGLTLLAAELLDRPSNIYSASISNNSLRKPFLDRLKALASNTKLNLLPKYDEPLNTLQDLESYKQVYLPLNETTYTQQLKALKDLISDAKIHKLKILVVEMPLTTPNMSLLPNSFWIKYRRDISDICKEAQISYLDVSRNVEYKLADFEDSCHLNSRGGGKFFNYLAKVICQTNNDENLSPTNKQ